jgi:hypothetical protein
MSYWDDLAAHPDIGAGFDARMGIAGHGVPDPVFDLTGGWDAIRTVVDVGGGTGAMLAEILRARPTSPARPRRSTPRASPIGSPRSARASSIHTPPAATCTSCARCSTTGPRPRGHRRRPAAFGLRR